MAAGRRRRVAWLAVLVLVLAACAAAPPASDVQRLRIEYATGAIPPPYNYSYVIEANFDADGAAVAYDLTYLYREGLSPAELAQAGYGPQDDITWRGRLSRNEAAAWRDVAGTALLRAADEAMPGADSMTVIVVTDADERRGVPVDRAPWEQMARQVDQAARAELGIQRAQP